MPQLVSSELQQAADDVLSQINDPSAAVVLAELANKTSDVARKRAFLSNLARRLDGPWRASVKDIKVAQEEILRRVQTLAAMYQIAPDKFLKDLQKRNGLVEIYDQLAHEKVMEFLENNAKMETVPAVEANPS